VKKNVFFERALITGATSGIGEALAHLLSKKGIQVILSGRNQEKLKNLGRELQAEAIIVADLKVKEERQRLIDVIREKKPDLVINNAGFGLYGAAHEFPVEDQLSILEVNGMASLELTLEAVRSLVGAQKKGLILNISSVAGEFPCPGMSVYGGTKAFLTSVSQALNTELSLKGIHVLVSCPGMIATDFANRAAKKNIKISGGPVLSAPSAAQHIWKQIQKRKEKDIFNWVYRLGCLFARYLAPTSLIKLIIWNRIKKRV
jgi:uncharacterized protein